MRKVLAALLVVGFAVVPARADERHSVTLRGSRSASAEVTFAHRFRPVVGITEAPDLSVTTKGTYAGVWFESVRDPAHLAIGAVVVPATTGLAGALPVAWGSSDEQSFSLPAGRYRVHLLTDGASVVRIGVDGLDRDLSLAPTAATPSKGTLRHVTTGAVGAAGQASIGLVERRTTTTVLVATADTDGPLSSAEVCVRQDASPVCESSPKNPWFQVVGGGPGTRSSMSAAMFFYPGDLATGEHDAEYTMAAAGMPHGGLWAFALTIR